MNVTYKLVNITLRKVDGSERKSVTRDMSYDFYCDLKRRLESAKPSYTVDASGTKNWFIESLKIVR